MFEIKSSLMLRYMAQATTIIQPHAFGMLPPAFFFWAMPNKSKEIYTDVGYGHSPYYNGKANSFCGSSVLMEWTMPNSMCDVP